MAAIVRRKGATLLALGGMPDHVHLLIRLKADLSLANLVGALKSVSSKWVHEKSDPIPGFAWQEGYAAFSVSPSREAAVRTYILNQEAHHRRNDFKGELLAHLIKHKVEFDPAYVFD